MLNEIGTSIATLPGDKKFFSKTARLFEERMAIAEGRKPVDWAMGELLAYGTLLHEGYPVRISGQDVERGTFSHRHAVVRVEDSEEQYLPLNHLSENRRRLYL